MPSDVAVNEDVKDLIKDIIAKNNIQEISDIKYQPGSQAGDGYVSRTLAVDIVNGKESFHVFLKCAINVKSTENVPIEKMYITEINFYDVVYPAYLKFIEERGIEDGFRHAPKCYATSPKNIVALENLRDKGFTLFDRGQTMNDSHLTLVLKTFAKFHAVSFAYKDQKRDEYDKLVEKSYDFFSKMAEDPGYVKMIEKMVNDFLVKLDPVKDKVILDKSDGLASKLSKAIGSARKSLNEYSVLTQGDCWCNNMMFLYEGEDNRNPVDIMLIDWQILRPASPVFDISYFFYTIASEEALDKLQHYLTVYHEELSKQIRELGSDPDTLYPFEILEAEWKQHCQYGFGMAFTLIRIMLSEKDEIVDMENLDFDNSDQMGNMFSELKNEDEFVNRMKILANHLLKNDYL